jgi:hypothetical protein
MVNVVLPTVLKSSATTLQVLMATVVDPLGLGDGLPFDDFTVTENVPLLPDLHTLSLPGSGVELVVSPTARVVGVFLSKVLAVVGPERDSEDVALSNALSSAGLPLVVGAEIDPGDVGLSKSDPPPHWVDTIALATIINAASIRLRCMSRSSKVMAGCTDNVSRRGGWTFMNSPG